MKYWKGLPGTPKEGFVGTRNDNGFVPDSEAATIGEYNAYVAAHPIPVKPDYVAMYAAAVTDSEKITVVAKAQGLIP